MEIKSESAMSVENARRYFLSKKAEITLNNLKTGSSIALRSIRNKRAMEDGKKSWFISRIIGENNKYLGMLIHNSRDNKLSFVITRASKISVGSKEYKVVNWLIRVFESGVDNKNLEILHCGRCGVCGKKLTTPRSIEIGIGPYCEKRLAENYGILEGKSD